MRTALVALLLGGAVIGLPPAIRAAAANAGAPGAPSASGAPDHLTVDGLVEPIGIDDAPQFAWRVSDSRRGAVQSAYRILVSRTPTTTPGSSAVVWDSGRVASSDQSFVSFAGPALGPDAVYWWTVQTWSADGRVGPFAVPQRFETGLHDHDWQAAWIRRTTSDPVDAQDEYTYARKEVRLAKSPIVRARAYVSADHQYQLWVNGVRADAGEAFSYPDSQYYQASDVTPLLRAGSANAIGLLYHWYGLGKGRPQGEPGVIAQVSIEHADGTRELVVTDGSWRVTRAPWLPSTQRNEEEDPVDYTEHIDGAAYPAGWDESGFDDSLWRAPAVVGRPPVLPWSHLISQRTRIVEEPVTPVKVTTLANGAVVADYGQVIAAVPTVAFRNGVPGRAITMHAGYLLDEPAPGQPVVGVPGQVSTTRGNQHTDMSYAYVQSLGAQTFRPFDYLGFRYFQVDNPGEPLGRDQLVAYARHNAVPDEAAATFSSSDPTIDAIFGLARHSALFGSQEQFIDTPTREKGPFLRDSFNISETAMRAFGEQNLTRRALVEFAQSQVRYWAGQGRLNAIYPSGQGKRDIPDFTEIYPEWVWQYYSDTGDRALLAQLYPTISAVADYVAHSIDPKTGLVTNLPGGDGDYLYGIVDWPKNMRYGYDMATVARTTVNMLAVDVFERVGQAAAALGLPPAERDRQTARRDALVAAINARLTRPDGVYIDGLHADGTRSSHASQHANAYAIAYGVVPAGHRDAVGRRVAALGMAMGPQTAQLLLDALHGAGLDSALVGVLDDARHDGWANVLAQGGTFTWETWEPSDANGDSMSHGWGSTVLVSIQQALLGVTSTAPGFAALDVRPPAGALASARGTVPTPRGPVTVAWSSPSRAGGAFSLDVTVPANATATVFVPARGPTDVTEGGHPLRSVAGVRFVRMDGDLAVLSVGAGTYDFRSSRVPAAFVAPSSRPRSPGRARSPGTPAGASPSDTGTQPSGAAAPGETAGSARAASASHHHHRVSAWLALLFLVQLALLLVARRVQARNA